MAQLNYLINAPNNQWWRFITPMFVHIDMLHLVMNMFSLLILGPFVEKLTGRQSLSCFRSSRVLQDWSASYLRFVRVSRMECSGLLSLKRPMFPSAGASGALFGLVGVLFVFGIKFRHELPEGFKRVFGTGPAANHLYQLVHRFYRPQFYRQLGTPRRTVLQEPHSHCLLIIGGPAYARVLRQSGACCR